MISISKFTLGQFAPRQSIVHDLDPRTKVIATFIIMFLLLFTHRLEILLLFFLESIFFIHISKLHIGVALKNIKPFLWLFLFLTNPFFPDTVNP